MRSRLGSAVAVVVMGLLAIGSADGRRAGKGTPATDKSTEVEASEPPGGGRPRKGELGSIEVPGESEVWVSVDEKAFSELNTFSSRRNQAAIEQMMDQGRVLVCTKGTKVTVVARGSASTTVRIMDGKYEGATGIVPNEFLRK